jgi:hypothetical protein
MIINIITDSNKGDIQMKRIITLTLIATLPGLAHAHGNASDSIIAYLQHFLSSPEHFWPLLVLAGLAITFKDLPKHIMRRIKIKSRT